MIRPFKIRRFNVATTFDDVELSATCRIVGNTMTVTIDKPFERVVTQVYVPYSDKSGMRIARAKDLAIDELEKTYIDFLTIAKDFETYRDIVYRQRRYLLNLKKANRALKTVIEDVERQSMENKIDMNEAMKSRRAINNALGMLEHDAQRNYEQLIRQHKLTEIAFDYTSQIVVWMMFNEGKAKELIKADSERQAILKDWMDSGTDETWEEWLDRQKQREDR